MASSKGQQLPAFHKCGQCESCNLLFRALRIAYKMVEGWMPDESGYCDFLTEHEPRDALTVLFIHPSTATWEITAFLMGSLICFVLGEGRKQIRELEFPIRDMTADQSFLSPHVGNSLSIFECQNWFISERSQFLQNFSLDYRILSIVIFFSHE